MAFDATEFRQKLQHGGARPNLFQVHLNIPGNTGEPSQEFSFMCQSAQLPGMTVGVATTHYFGRQVKLHGDRAFEDWGVSVINDEDFAVRNALDAWQNAFAELDHGAQKILNSSGVQNDWTNLYVDIDVVQYSKEGSLRDTGNLRPIKKYTMKNAWPTSIGAIELSWDANDTIETFDVNFTYDYFITEELNKNNTGMTGK